MLKDHQAQDRVAFGQRLRTVRQANGITMQQAADAAGITRFTLSKYENGHTAPTADTLPYLAAAVQGTYEELLGPAWPLT